ncbi:MAG: hypothetical protein ABL878_15390 [Burkholderiales bacterium]
MGQLLFGQFVKRRIERDARRAESSKSKSFSHGDFDFVLQPFEPASDGRGPGAKILAFPGATQQPDELLDQSDPRTPGLASEMIEELARLGGWTRISNNSDKT